MNRNFYWLLFSLLSGCIPRQSYLLSPQNASSMVYHVIPMKVDSMPSAIYVNGVFSTGQANDRGTDHVFLFQGGVHRSHNFGNFQAFYGGSLTMGSYLLAEFYKPNRDDLGNLVYPYQFDSLNHMPASNNFFGSYGFSGGINIVATHQHLKKNRHSEWRIVGIETSMQNEFGKYADLRSKLPDSAANAIYRKRFSAYLGLYTEWLWSNQQLTEFGVKISVGEDLSPGSCYGRYYSSMSLPLYTLSFNYHITKQKFTGYVQGNFGTYASNIQFGLSYRLGKK
jgi:hypothetical protein